MFCRPRILFTFLVINIELNLCWPSTRYGNSIHHARSIAPGSDPHFELKGILTDAIAKGAELAVEQCKVQFKWERWNCPDGAFSKKGTVPVTREMAFVSAITSAGIVYSVTRSCSRGELKGCKCNVEEKEKGEAGGEGEEGEAAKERNLVWGGCSDDFTMGKRVAEIFLGALEHGSADLNAQINLHNYKLGKAVVEESMRKTCKCHGVSGSCTTQSCWKRVGTFRQIGEILKRHYERAVRVDWNFSNRLVNLDIPATQMAFLADSPDYCKPNTTTGWEGTAGRVCSRAKGTSRSERRSCRELCRSCGHQVKKRTRERTRHCNCTFQWCCNVVCSQCTDTVEEQYCDATPIPYGSL